MLLTDLVFRNYYKMSSALYISTKHCNFLKLI